MSKYNRQTLTLGCQTKSIQKISLADIFQRRLRERQIIINGIFQVFKCVDSNCIKWRWEHFFSQGEYIGAGSSRNLLGKFITQILKTD